LKISGENRLKILLFMTLWAFSFTAKAHIGFYGEPVNPPDSIAPNDTIKLPYEFKTKSR
jgi:hypothetical protein